MNSMIVWKRLMDCNKQTAKMTLELLWYFGVNYA
jgi:hypothetical protein